MQSPRLSVPASGIACHVLHCRTNTQSKVQCQINASTVHDHKHVGELTGLNLSVWLLSILCQSSIGVDAVTMQDDNKDPTPDSRVLGDNSVLTDLWVVDH